MEYLGEFAGRLSVALCLVDDFEGWFSLKNERHRHASVARADIEYNQMNHNHGKNDIFAHHS